MMQPILAGFYGWTSGESRLTKLEEARTSSATPPPPPDAPGPRLHLVYLDGLRGLAALYVVVFHLYMKLYINSGRLQFGWPVAAYGGLAVDVFIVLSGYCLMLPIVRSPDASLSGGAYNFLRRRAWRILPPYYAALAVTIGLLLIAQWFSRSHGVTISAKADGLTTGAVVSHLFLIHNTTAAWKFTIDGSMWSVATEWQIYFFLPAFLLPLWRRWGPGAALAGAWAVGLLPLLLHPEFAESSHSWLLGLFAMGMTAAGINFPREPQRSARRHPWGVTASVLFALLVGVLAAYGPPVQELWVTDVLTGAAASALLVYCTLFRSLQGPRPAPPVLRFLESGALVRLGAFSYSLYLVHGPMLAILILLLHGRVSGNSLLLLMVGMGLPLTLGASYLFYLCFERPFLNKRSAAARAKAEVVL